MSLSVCPSCGRTNVVPPRFRTSHSSATSVTAAAQTCRDCRCRQLISVIGVAVIALILVPLCAAAIAAWCLSHEIHGPFWVGKTGGGLANLAFWVVAGMGIGLCLRAGLRFLGARIGGGR